MRSLTLFGLVCVVGVLMIFKDERWLDTPHAVSLCIAVACLVLGVIGAVTSAQQVLRQNEPPQQGAHARRPPVRGEPLP